MPDNNTPNRFSAIGLLVILGVCFLGLGILLSAIQNAREAARRANCTNNMTQIGLCMQNYYDARHYFPGSAEMVGKPPNQKVGGWGFLFKSLPGGFYDWSDPLAIDPSLIKNTLGYDESKKIDPLTHQNAAIQSNRNFGFQELLCPSNPNKSYEDPANKKIAFTNYKAMGATTAESLKLCENPGAAPPYGTAAQHPDGALYPTNNGIPKSSISDGLTHTVMVAETIDDTKSCWLAGADATLVGMPLAASYSQCAAAGGSRYWAPLDFNGRFYGGATPALQAMRTYLAFDFRPGRADAGAYPPSVGRTPAYGPSSAHPGIVNHLFCDGSVRPVRKDVDYAVYFFLITRANGEPPVPPSAY
jgi:hypothetical protein